MKDLQKIHILLAEDTHTDAEATLHALKELGLMGNVTWVKDGQEALDYVFCTGPFIDRKSGDPTLLMLDLNMPKVNGLDVLKILKTTEQTKYIPIIMLTSSAEEPDITYCYEYGVNSYIVKPVAPKKFSEEVSRAGFYWNFLNRSPVMAT
ncbi:MAG: response regulator [Burkholderiaceae bacterium]|uniref:Response regulator n=1 Tax=Herminiimonas contaminans TaxID=1111140 RepID=A0ABS0EPX2_9BURK|nr:MULTISPECIES: response regulator [Oxalobacteraceae]MBF8176903.1 response regulator [Herminiimonas contaminans]MBX9801096.1 response regulator [Burkholderiaceae bacterium]